MRIGLGINYAGGFKEVAAEVADLERAGLDVVFVPEAYSFDAVKIGLTATPALHTTQIFGAPAYTYGYREAVIDGYLVDYEPPIQITTELSASGIQWKAGEELKVYDVQRNQIELFKAPDEIKLEVDAFNRKVITESFNRVVCEYLAGELDFLFIAPERLRVPGFPEMLARRTPALIAVDEAHFVELALLVLHADDARVVESRHAGHLAQRLRQVGQVAPLEGQVAGVTRGRGPHVGAAHRVDHRAVAARALAEHAAPAGPAAAEALLDRDAQPAPAQE